jgi:glutamate dehydrogenase (NAD(P)+)
VPDILSNAAGVTVGYFEWVQGNIRLIWSEEEILARLHKLLVQVCQRVFELAKDENISLRSAAMKISLERILEARRLRGLYP